MVEKLTREIVEADLAEEIRSDLLQQTEPPATVHCLTFCSVRYFGHYKKEINITGMDVFCYFTEASADESLCKTTRELASNVSSFCVIYLT